MSIKFIADVMLGKLAKWLRILGIDTLYSSSFDDKEIIFLAVNESRIVLTRDNRLQKDLGNKKSVLIKSDNLFEQLFQVIDTFNLKIEESSFFSRCLTCNSELMDISKDRAINKVPPYILKIHSDFRYCKDCDKFYWSGTHRDKIFKTIEILKNKSPVKTGL